RNRTDLNGAGIYNSGQLTVENARITENVAVSTADFSSFNSSGGGIFHTGDGVALVAASCIDLNTALQGGGIYTDTNSAIVANGNYWGHRNGFTFSQGSTTGDSGDVINFQGGQFLSIPPNLVVPPLEDIPTCFRLAD